jgi:Uncharacterized protein conserved in bacteria (DUF2090)/Transketolase, thiamine diphosphate binding domain
MIGAIAELQEASIEPDVWKIEGIDRPEDCAKVVGTVRRGGRDRVGCIVLGRGEDDTKVRQWLKTAAAVPGFIGFAVGRTSFWEPLTDWKDGRIARDAAVSEIARRYREWVDILESGCSPGRAAVAQGGGMTLRIDNSPTIKSRRHPFDQICINTIRTLAIDAIQAANSAHPGTPMAMAPVGYYL